jgi:hypothetical protein
MVYIQANDFVIKLRISGLWCQTDDFKCDKKNYSFNIGLHLGWLRVGIPKWLPNHTKSVLTLESKHEKISMTNQSKSFTPNDSK